MESPLLILLLFAGAVYVARIWYADLRAETAGRPNKNALQGATPVGMTAVLIGIIGAIILVAVETSGELALGVAAEQSDISALFLLSMIGAGIIEEVIFRGYFVVQKRGTAWLVASILGFSLLFALLHYQYYIDFSTEGDQSTLTINIGAKEGWTLAMLFLNSLWFYSLRFFKWNPNRSLLPCFAAHIASNLSVFLVKLAQGHVTTWW